MNRKHLLFLVVALQLLALVGMIGSKSFTVFTGRDVVLETRPVDPRNLMRGDFVRLNFSITRLSPDLPGLGGRVIPPGETVFVVLRPDGDLWVPARVETERPGRDETFIRGTVREAGRSLRVDYGIDSYYVPEGTGRPLERVRHWRVKLDRRGDAVIEGPAN